MDSEIDLHKLRQEFLYLQEKSIYLNHAATGPLPVCALRAMEMYLQEHSAGRIDTYEVDREIIRECREHLAMLINAESPDRIALVHNTSDALNIVARGVPWERGDRILVCEQEFPANVVPYYHLAHLGVEVDLLQLQNGGIDLHALQKAMTPRTRLFSLSAVQFLNGFRADLASIGAMCRQKNIWFVVDGIQAVGAIPIDVQSMHIDALACGGQKWLLGPQGTGFLYLSERFQSIHRPPFVGWLSVEHPWHFFDYQQPLAPSARRYETGTLNSCGFYGLNASVGFLLNVGIHRIHQRIQQLTSILCEELQRFHELTLLTSFDAEHRAGIVALERRDRGSLQETYNKLRAHGVVVSLREDKLRFSPHFYNTEEEIDQVLNILKTVL